jgi:hypothetical protein
MNIGIIGFCPWLMPAEQDNAGAGDSMTTDRMELWEQLYRYWRLKSIDGRPPARADLDPVIDIPHLTPHLMILDVLPDGYQYRLAGSDLGLRLGEELTGKRVGRATVAEGQWYDLLDTVSREQKPLMVTADAPFRGGKRMGLVLPLVGLSGATEQILAGIFFGNDFRPGMRLGVLEVQELMSDPNDPALQNPDR